MEGSEETGRRQARIANGQAAAAILAAGIGSACLGVVVVLGVASSTVKSWLNWWEPVGPLSGKSSVGILTWLAAWAVLHVLWRNQEVPFRRVWTIALVLIGAGFLLTFPPIFEAFGGH